MPLSVPLVAGTILYKFQLTCRIGSGGYGDVWLARDNSINRDVAVKVLDASTATIDERLREARIGNQLNHQNLVKVHYADVVSYGDTHLVLIAMDYHAAGSILGHLNCGNFMPLRDSVRYMVDILRGLEYLHEHGIFHSDIKPKNILVGSAGEGILTDYGISCHSPTLEAVPLRDAYILHIAPEALTTKQIGVHTDVYQVGMTLFRLLNGIGIIRAKYNRVGRANFLDLVSRGKIVAAADYASFVPRNLRTIVSKAIAADPTCRYQSALEMRRALEAISFSGYWTCNAQGKLEGYNDGYLFRFEQLPRMAGLFDFTAFKMNKASGRETRVTAYCGKMLSRAETEDLKNRFIQHVVTGKPQ